MYYKTLPPPPQICGGVVGVSYSPNVAYLACWGWWSGFTGGRSRVAAVGSRGQQEWGDAAGPGLGGEGVLVEGSKGGRSGVPTVAHYSAREEGTGGAGTLGEENLQRPYVPPSCDWCVPH